MLPEKDKGIFVLDKSTSERITDLLAIRIEKEWGVSSETGVANLKKELCSYGARGVYHMMAMKRLGQAISKGRLDEVMSELGIEIAPPWEAMGFTLNLTQLLAGTGMFVWGEKKEIKCFYEDDKNKLLVARDIHKSMTEGKYRSMAALCEPWKKEDFGDINRIKLGCEYGYWVTATAIRSGLEFYKGDQTEGVSEKMRPFWQLIDYYQQWLDEMKILTGN